MLKRILYLFFTFTLLSVNTHAQEVTEEDYTHQLDSIEQLFTYRHDTVELANGIGRIIVPDGFRYLDADQSEKVLVELWGNPWYEGMTLGMILPENQGVMSDSGYVFNIEYNEIGYVKDGDAGDIDYDDLLKDMQDETAAGNKQRTDAGYEPISIIGWAASPFYDKDRKILHWAKEVQFGDNPEHTLNYNVRVLGRKGVLVLNAVGSMSSYGQVEQDLAHVLNIVQFNDGYRYGDFNPSVDEVASWTIGGLVAGKVLAKAGFFAVILKFWKFIAIGVVALVRIFWSRIRGKKANDGGEGTAIPEQLT
ncbi:hypothetical protein GCM10007415_34350 [Parapedobacter pyrenivorans]|uniref:Membrane-anchored protein n=1 Tax=Parapedobacter pyrenivorans TaxID=1305674 RepID=A0A917MFD0_9SPHI|nr:DUF2167 domain-containing protein [Parapedobacter pyrenivorans]GGG96264.1 hypothetical protein GCM10007415_34350 [Parapedobacter pyrenivorans]